VRCNVRETLTLLGLGNSACTPLFDITAVLSRIVLSIRTREFDSIV
jgi:hypothetical protein